MVLAQTRFLEEVGRVRRQCPLWVKSGHMRCNTPCPLYPNSDRKRIPANGHVRFTPESGHVPAQLGMSAMGQ